MLALDNCEHLVSACAHLAEKLLSACPHLTLLATSREALGIPGETTWRVPSLQLPDPQRLPALADMTGYASVRLFYDRAQAVMPQFELTAQNAPAVAQVCRQLDGIPLAIELAAARVKVLPVEQIASRLNDRFNLLSAGSRTAQPRQQTLRAAMDWSYDLLEEPEQALLRRLSVFSGGVTLQAVEAVAGDQRRVEREREPLAGLDTLPVPTILNLLARLVDKSLVTMDAEYPESESVRHRLLETVRQYAHETREPGQAVLAVGEQRGHRV